MLKLPSEEAKRLRTEGQLPPAHKNGHSSAGFRVTRRVRRRLLDLSMRVTVYNPMTASSDWGRAAVPAEWRHDAVIVFSEDKTLPPIQSSSVLQVSTPFHDTGWTPKSKCCKNVTEEATTGVGYDGVVKGYGHVFALRDFGVLSFEYDLICALQARVEGIKPADIENVVSEIGILISSKLDSVKGCRVLLFDGFLWANDAKIGGKRARVCAHGRVDKGCVFALRDFECDLICALQVCTEGFELADAENIMSEIDTKLDNVKGCRPSFNDGNMRANDVKFGGERAGVCDLVDKVCVFAP